MQHMAYTPESLAAEQRELELETFNYDFAWRLGAKMRELAAARHAPVAIDVAHGPDLIFATLLPGVEFSTRQPYPDARRLLDAGVRVALASDCNPGSSFTSSMPLCGDEYS